MRPLYFHQKQLLIIPGMLFLSWTEGSPEGEMEMRAKNGELKMPKNYVDMEDADMEYDAGFSLKSFVKVADILGTIAVVAGAGVLMGGGGTMLGVMLIGGGGISTIMGLGNKKLDNTTV